MINEKSRLTAATVNPANEGQKQSKDTQILRADFMLFQKYLRDYDFNIHEAMPDIYEAIASEKRIAETRENPNVKAAMLRNMNLIMFALGQLLDDNQNLTYRERDRFPLYFDKKRNILTTINVSDAWQQS